MDNFKNKLPGMIKLPPQILTTRLPTWFHFALTNKCNLSCPFCWRNRKNLKGNKFEHAPDKTIDQWLDLIDDNLDVVHPAGGGEPLLHPRFGEFVQKALKIQKNNPDKKPEIRIVTNGTLIGRWPVILEAFKTGRIQIIVSIESADPERYKSFRAGGNLDVVDKNLRDIQNARKQGQNFQPRTTVAIDSILSRQNIEDIDGLIDFALRLEVDRITLKSLQSNSDSPVNFKHEDAVLTSSQITLMKELKKIEESLDVNINFSGFPNIDEDRDKTGQRLPCEEIFRSIRFYPDGNLYTCCPERTIKSRAGNLSIQTLQEIWNSHKMDEVRRKILSGQPGSICSGCIHINTIAGQAPLLRKKYLANY